MKKPIRMVVSSRTPHLILHVVKGSVQNVCGAEGFPDWAKPIIEAFLKLPEQSAS